MEEKQEAIIGIFKTYIKELVQGYGPIWMDWPDDIQSIRMSQGLGWVVEGILGTNHYDLMTCTGHHFAVYVYNEVSDTPLETF